MKFISLFGRTLAALAIFIATSMFQLSARAVSEVSNLGDTWTEGGIGDIHALFPGGAFNGNDTAHFRTGAGSYSLNSITLELENDSGYPAGVSAPQSISIQLFQRVGNTEVLLGNLGNPVVNPAPTQWPRASNPGAYTTYIDFSPLAAIDLTGLSDYSLVIGMPANSPVDAALVFTKSFDYTSLDDWSMDPTTTGNSSANGETLKMAVNATRIPDPANTALLLVVGIAFLAGVRHFPRNWIAGLGR